MQLFVTVDSKRIHNLNGSKNEADVTVDLSELWKQIVQRFTHIYMEISLEIPVVVNQSIQIQLAREFSVKDIVDKKVRFTVEYGGEDDSSRLPSGVAKVKGYQKVSVKTV